MNNSKVSDVLYYLLLILLLCVSSFLVLFYETSAYDNMNNINDTYDSNHLISSYLSNKMRSGKLIKCEDDKLVIESDELVTYIYINENGLCELTTLKGYSIDFNSGEKIFALDDFNVINKEEKIFINYRVGEKNNEVVYSLRGGNHE